MKNTQRIARFKTTTSTVAYYGVQSTDWVIRVSTNTLGMQSVVVLTRVEYESDMRKIKSNWRPEELLGYVGV